ncbi:hypothetical protein VNO77_07679 [Canavalia gladiata]|uniref:Secreted protein n=1 Tax=Canavalia gladiata TaxID=3824 RepID=A0AAN9M8L1_CANGL
MWRECRRCLVLLLKKISSLSLSLSICHSGLTCLLKVMLSVMTGPSKNEMTAKPHRRSNRTGLCVHGRTSWLALAAVSTSRKLNIRENLLRVYWSPRQWVCSIPARHFFMLSSG